MSPAVTSTSEPVAPPAISFGVDVTEIARTGELIDKYGMAAVRRICDAEETDWVLAQGKPDPTRLAVVFALKEACVKSMAGRPAGFRWQYLQTRVPVPVVPTGPRLLLDGFSGDLQPGHDLTVTAGCAPIGPAADRAATRLPGAGPVLGAGRYLIQGGQVLAAVCFWKEQVR